TPHRRGGACGRTRSDPHRLRRADARLAEERLGPPRPGRVRAGRRRPGPRRREPPCGEPPAARAEPRRRLPRQDGTHSGRRRRRATRDGGSVKRRLPGGPVPYLAGRSVVRTLRQPAYVLPPILFPLALLAFNSAGLASATRLPGFPSRSFLPFILAVPFIQGALFATMNAGTDLARDIQSGFLTRLALTPVRQPALIAGHLAGVAVLGFLQACVYLAVGLAVGSPLRSGPAGAVVLLVLATLIAIGFGALGAFMALRTGSAESIQGLFPPLFVGLFISSLNAPRHPIA